jgi:SAM-dependent methyltransferase
MRARRGPQSAGTSGVSASDHRLEPEMDISMMLSKHPDRIKWNGKYAATTAPRFGPHPLVASALGLGLPEGPVLEVACGQSGSTLELARVGYRVTAADISDVGLQSLAEEARRRGLGDKITLVNVDLLTWRPEERAFALVLCTRYWDREVFRAASRAVSEGGLIAWEAFTLDEIKHRPTFRPEWCVTEEEPASLLPRGFTVLEQSSLDDGQSAARRLLARRTAGE